MVLLEGGFSPCNLNVNNQRHTETESVNQLCSGTSHCERFLSPHISPSSSSSKRSQVTRRPRLILCSKPTSGETICCNKKNNSTRSSPSWRPEMTVQLRTHGRNFPHDLERCISGSWKWMRNLVLREPVRCWLDLDSQRRTRSCPLSRLVVVGGMGGLFTSELNTDKVGSQNATCACPRFVRQGVSAVAKRVVTQ